MLNKSEALFTKLFELGVRHVFFVAGGNAMFLNEALRQSELEGIPMHHEQACAMAAEAYARRTGKVGVCLATSGPGVTNLLTGLAGAYLDSVPVIAIIGQSKGSLSNGQQSEYLRQAGLFEVNNREILNGVSKEFISITSRDSAAKTTSRGFEIATAGRPGPVVIELSLDVQSSPEFEIDSAPESVGSESLSLTIESNVFRGKRFARPLMLVGNGVLASGASQRLIQLFERLGLPFLTTQLAKGFSYYSHPLFIGHPGPRGNRSANLALAEADLVITIGSSLGSQTVGYESELFAQQALKVIQENGSSVSSIRRFSTGTIYVDAGIEAFVNWLEQELKNTEFSSDLTNWLERLTHLKANLSVQKEPHLRSESGHNLYHVVEAVNEFLRVFSKPANLVSDAGLAFYVVGQALELTPGSTYTVSGGLGAMGYALPAAIGVATAYPNELTIALSGDGSTQMNIQEFATLSRMSASLVYVVLNNDGYASIRNTQDSFFGGRIGSSEDTGVSMPKWPDIAKAYGLDFMRVSAAEDLRDRLHIGLNAVGPRVIEIECQDSQAIAPFTPNYVDESGILRSKPLHQMSPSREFDEFGLATLN